MIEAMKQALEALEEVQEFMNTSDWFNDKITSLRQAIAELESQEPVSALWQHGETGRFRVTAPDSITDCDARWFKVGDLYLRPPQRTEREPDVVMHWHSHTWTTINPPPKNSGDVNLYYASPQRTESEPVAYINVEMRRLEFAHDYVKWDTPTTIKLDKIPLYTHSPQRTWVGLTDEEFAKCWHSNPDKAMKNVDAKLKERNT